MESIHMGSLSSDAFYALDRLLLENEWGDLYPWIEPEQAALLFFRLRKTPDDPLIFPRGKWATIQRIEGLIEDAVAEELIKAALKEDGKR